MPRKTANNLFGGLAFSILILLLAGGQNHIHASGEFSVQSPVSGSTYSTTLNVGLQQLSDVIDGSLKMVFIPQSYSGSSIDINFITPVSTNPFSYDLNPADIHVDSDISSISPAVSHLPDGRYTVQFRWFSLSHISQQVSITNVTIDTTTLTPSLNLPVSSSAHYQTLPVSIVIPEAPTAGTIRLTALNTVTSDSYVMTLSNSLLSTSFTLDLNDISAAASNVTSSTANVIPAGIYNFSLSYQDVFGNPAATRTVTNVRIAGVPNIVINSPTMVSDTIITDTSVTATSIDPISKDAVVVDPSTSAVYTSWHCTQTTSYQVDCAITITGGGSLVIAATGSLGGKSTLTNSYYQVQPSTIGSGITLPPPPTVKHTSSGSSSNTPANSTDPVGVDFGIPDLIPLPVTPVSYPQTNVGKDDFVSDTITAPAPVAAAPTATSPVLWIILLSVIAAGGSFLVVKIKQKKQTR